MSSWLSMDRVTCRDPMTRVRTSAVSISTVADRGSLPLAALGGWRRVIPRRHSGVCVTQVCDTHAVGLALTVDKLLSLFMTKIPSGIVACHGR